MKKNIIFLVMFLLLIVFTGCGAKEKLEQKAGEALAEKIIEEAGGGDVDIDGETVTITGEDGTEATFGGTEWPTSDLANSFPEFTAGKVNTVMDGDGSLFIVIEEVTQEEFAQYLDEIKQTFTEDSYSIETEGNVAYGAVNAEGVGLNLSYSTDNTVTITAASQAE